MRLQTLQKTLSHRSCSWLAIPLQTPYKTQLEPMLQQYVLPCYDAPAGHVRAKACWVTQQYADIKFADGRGRGATFMQLFQKTLERLDDPELPVGCPVVPACYLGRQPMQQP